MGEENKVYTIEEIADLTGASIPVINRWSGKLRDSKVLCKKGKRVWYLEPFVLFVKARAESQGPSNLPPDENIIRLLDLYLEYGPDEESIAASMRLPTFIVRGQLELMGLLQ